MYTCFMDKKLCWRAFGWIDLVYQCLALMTVHLLNRFFLVKKAQQFLSIFLQICVIIDYLHFYILLFLCMLQLLFSNLLLQEKFSILLLSIFHGVPLTLQILTDLFTSCIGMRKKFMQLKTTILIVSKVTSKILYLCVCIYIYV